MAENLRYVDSVATPNLKTVYDFWNPEYQLRCYRDNWVENYDDKCKIGGALYSWTAAMDIDPKWASDSVGSIITLPHRGICPEGWHIPDTTEWNSAGKLATIRNNVAGWGLSSKVPNFEQFVRNFWYKEYGLDSCTAKKEGVMKAASAGKQKVVQIA